MQQAIKFELVPTNKILVAVNGPTIDQINRTLSEELTKKEMVMYSKSIDKVLTKQKLNVRDLNIFDKIDEITMAAYGHCLKDSLVTKARLKACKRYKVNFNDRGGLVDHLKMVEGGTDLEDEQHDVKNIIDEFIDIVGHETAESFADAALKVRDGLDLSMAELKAIARVAAYSSMNFAPLREDTTFMKALEKACADYRLDVNDIIGATEAFNNVH